jgi:hypothetical protein
VTDPARSRHCGQWGDTTRFGGNFGGKRFWRPPTHDIGFTVRFAAALAVIPCFCIDSETFTAKLAAYFDIYPSLSLSYSRFPLPPKLPPIVSKTPDN